MISFLTLVNEAQSPDQMYKLLQEKLGAFTLTLEWAITQLRKDDGIVLDDHNSADEGAYYLFFDQGVARATLAMDQANEVLTSINIKHWIIIDESEPLPPAYRQQIVGLQECPVEIDEYDTDSGMSIVAIYNNRGELQERYSELSEGDTPLCYSFCGNGLRSLTVTGQDGCTLQTTPGTPAFYGLKGFLQWYVQQ